MGQHAEETPQPGRWTKLWSALMFVTFGLLCSSYLVSATAKCLDTLKGVFSKPNEQATDIDLDPALTSAQEWRKITGKRATKTADFVSDPW